VCFYCHANPYRYGVEYAVQHADELQEGDDVREHNNPDITSP
jgi:hypothetical protein